MTHSHKTKQGALRAARKDLGARAVEGVDFTLRNTGTGWIALKIPPANKAAADAQERRRHSPNRSAGAKSGHHKRAAAKVPEASKTDMLVSMMKQPAGATSKAMEEAASWKPESVRGLVGLLKKRGTTVESLKEPGAPTRYHIPEDGIGDVI